MGLTNDLARFEARKGEGLIWLFSGKLGIAIGVFMIVMLLLLWIQG